MLELKNITIYLSQDDKPILQDFSFTLNRGDKAVIIGEEGNGKSTLLKLLYRPQLVEDYCTYEGTIIKKGLVGYLPQAMPEANLPLTVSQFFENADLLSYPNLFNQLSLPLSLATSQQLVGSLSGGEKIKIQLANILMQQPDLLLLDEPTNDIDIQTLEWLEQFIQSSKLPILFVSHDETLIENTANVIIHMELLRRKTKPRVTVTRASYRAYIQSRSLSFDKQLQVANKQRSDYQAKMEKWQQIYNRVDHEQGSISRQNPSGGRLLKKKMKSVLAQGHRLQRQAEDFLDIPETEEAILTKFSEDISIPKSKVILDLQLDTLSVANRVLAQAVQLLVVGSAHIGITGRNGVGKSTLLELIWQQLRDRCDITAAYMPQDYATVLAYDKTPIAFLAARYTKADVTRARTFMGSMKFTHTEMTGKISALSGGQKAKLLFLDMVLRQANVLVLDEPTRNFSPLSNPVIRQTLASFGGAMISISHDRKYLEEVCTQVYELTPEGLFLRSSN